MGHVFGILHPPVLRRDKWGGNRWNTLAAEETRPGSLEEQNTTAAKSYSQPASRNHTPEVLQKPFSRVYLCFTPNASRHFCYVSGSLILVGGGHSTSLPVWHRAHLAKIVPDSPESAMCARLSPLCAPELFLPPPGRGYVVNLSLACCQGPFKTRKTFPDGFSLPTFCVSQH